MDIWLFLALIIIITALLVITRWYNIGILFGFILVLSLLGLYLSINSPIQIIESWDYKYTYNGTLVTNINIEPIVKDTSIFNNGITLLFLASLISSIMLWSFDNNEEEFN